jgi:hypothetical protein
MWAILGINRRKATQIVLEQAGSAVRRVVA